MLSGYNTCSNFLSSSSLEIQRECGKFHLRCNSGSSISTRSRNHALPGPPALSCPILQHETTSKESSITSLMNNCQLPTGPLRLKYCVWNDELQNLSTIIMEAVLGKIMSKTISYQNRSVQKWFKIKIIYSYQFTSISAMFRNSVVVNSRCGSSWFVSQMYCHWA